MIFNEHMEMVASRLHQERKRLLAFGDMNVARRAAMLSIDEKLEQLVGIPETCSVGGCRESATFDHEGAGKLFCDEHYVDKRNFRI